MEVPRKQVLLRLSGARDLPDQNNVKAYRIYVVRDYTDPSVVDNMTGDELSNFLKKSVLLGEVTTLPGHHGYSSYSPSNVYNFYDDRWVSGQYNHYIVVAVDRSGNEDDPAAELGGVLKWNTKANGAAYDMVKVMHVLTNDTDPPIFEKNTKIKLVGGIGKIDVSYQYTVTNDTNFYRILRRLTYNGRTPIDGNSDGYDDNTGEKTVRIVNGHVYEADSPHYNESGDLYVEVAKTESNLFEDYNLMIPPTSLSVVLYRICAEDYLGNQRLLTSDADTSTALGYHTAATVVADFDGYVKSYGLPPEKPSTFTAMTTVVNGHYVSSARNGDIILKARPVSRTIGSAVYTTINQYILERKTVSGAPNIATDWEIIASQSAMGLAKLSQAQTNGDTSVAITLDGATAQDITDLTAIYNNAKYKYVGIQEEGSSGHVASFKYTSASASGTVMTLTGCTDWDGDSVQFPAGTEVALFFYYKDTGLIPYVESHTEYTYRLRAVSYSGHTSEYAALAYNIRAVDEEPPQGSFVALPDGTVGVKARGAIGAIVLDWKWQVTGEEAPQYWDIWRKSSDIGSTSDWVKIDTMVSSTTYVENSNTYTLNTYTDNAPQPDSQQYAEYVVVPIDKWGNKCGGPGETCWQALEDKKGAATSQTVESAGDTTAPSPPSITGTTVGSDASVELSWKWGIDTDENPNIVALAADTALARAESTTGYVSSGEEEWLKDSNGIGNAIVGDYVVITGPSQYSGTYHIEEVGSDKVRVSPSLGQAGSGITYKIYQGYVDVADASQVTAGEKVVITSDTQQPIRTNATSISTNRIFLQTYVPPGYKTSENAKLYSNLGSASGVVGGSIFRRTEVIGITNNALGTVRSGNSLEIDNASVARVGTSVVLATENTNGLSNYAVSKITAISGNVITIDDSILYEPGTVDVTNGSKNIVGHNTQFTKYSSGDYITLIKTTSQKRYRIDTITDDTHLTLTESYTAATATDINYAVKCRIYYGRESYNPSEGDSDDEGYVQLTVIRSKNVSNYKDTYLEPGIYRYRVSNYDRSNNESVLSPEKPAAFIKADTVAPSKASNLRIMGLIGKIRFEWDPSPSPDIYLYGVSKKESGWVHWGTPDATSDPASDQEVKTTDSSYTIYNVHDKESDIKNWLFRVVAYDRYGNPLNPTTSDYVVSDSAKTDLTNYIKSTGNTPSDSCVTWDSGYPKDGGDSNALLKWTWHNDVASDIVRFRIRRTHHTSSDEVTIVANIEVDPDEDIVSFSYVDKGLTPSNYDGGQYKYEIQAISAAGLTTGWVGSNFFNVGDYTPPDCSGIGLDTAPHLGQVVLSWSDIQEHGIIYTIWRSPVNLAKTAYKSNGSSTYDATDNNCEKIGTVAGTKDGTQVTTFADNDYNATTGKLDRTIFSSNPYPLIGSKNKAYYFVTATDRWGNHIDMSAASGTGNDKNLISNIELEAPLIYNEMLDTDAPTGATINAVASGSPMKITLACSGAVDPDSTYYQKSGLFGYRIYREDTAYTGTVMIAASPELSGTNEWVYDDINVVAGHQYNYYVTAVDKAGNESAQTAYANNPVVAVDTVKPSKPTHVHVFGDIGALTLGWDMSSDAVPADYWEVELKARVLASGQPRCDDSSYGARWTNFSDPNNWDNAGDPAAASVKTQKTQYTVHNVCITKSVFLPPNDDSKAWIFRVRSVKNSVTPDDTDWVYIDGSDSTGITDYTTYKSLWYLTNFKPSDGSGLSDITNNIFVTADSDNDRNISVRIKVAKNYSMLSQFIVERATIVRGHPTSTEITDSDWERLDANIQYQYGVYDYQYRDLNLVPYIDGEVEYWYRVTTIDNSGDYPLDSNGDIIWIYSQSIQISDYYTDKEQSRAWDGSILPVPITDAQKGHIIVANDHMDYDPETAVEHYNMGDALSLDGSTQYAYHVDDNTLDMGEDDFMFCGVVMLTEDGEWQNIIHKNWSNNGSYLFGISNLSPPTFYVGIKNTSGNAGIGNFGGKTLNINRYYNFAVIFDRSGYIHLVIDGVYWGNKDISAITESIDNNASFMVWAASNLAGRVSNVRAFRFGKGGLTVTGTGGNDLEIRVGDSTGDIIYSEKSPYSPSHPGGLIPAIYRNPGASLSELGYGGLENAERSELISSSNDRTFELGTISNWVANNSTVSASNTYAHSGSYSMKFTASSTGGFAKLVSFNSLIKNSYYEFSAFVYNSDASEKNIMLWYYESGGVSKSRCVPVQSSSWNKVSLIFATLNPDVYIAIHFRDDNTSFSDWYIDDVSVKRIGEVAHWPMNEEGQPSTLADSTDNHLDLTTVGTPKMVKVYK